MYQIKDLLHFSTGPLNPFFRKKAILFGKNNILFRKEKLVPKEKNILF